MKSLPVGSLEAESFEGQVQWGLLVTGSASKLAFLTERSLGLQLRRTVQQVSTTRTCPAFASFISEHAFHSFHPPPLSQRGSAKYSTNPHKSSPLGTSGKHILSSFLHLQRYCNSVYGRHLEQWPGWSSHDSVQTTGFSPC